MNKEMWLEKYLSPDIRRHHEPMMSISYHNTVSAEGEYRRRQMVSRNTQALSPD